MGWWPLDDAWWVWAEEEETTECDARCFLAADDGAAAEAEDWTFTDTGRELPAGYCWREGPAVASMAGILRLDDGAIVGENVVDAGYDDEEGLKVLLSRMLSFSPLLFAFKNQQGIT